MILSISLYSLGGVKEMFKRKPNINPVTVVKTPLSYSIELHISIISFFAIFSLSLSFSSEVIMNTPFNANKYYKYDCNLESLSLSYLKTHDKEIRP
jgi:hypothetical protein